MSAVLLESDELYFKHCLLNWHFIFVTHYPVHLATNCYASDWTSMPILHTLQMSVVVITGAVTWHRLVLHSKGFTAGGLMVDLLPLNTYVNSAMKNVTLIHKEPILQFYLQITLVCRCQCHFIRLSSRTHDWLSLWHWLVLSWLSFTMHCVHLHKCVLIRSW